MLNVYVPIRLSDLCTAWIPRSACRGHSLTASGQPSPHTITKNRLIFHIHAQAGLQTPPHTPPQQICLSHRACLGPNPPHHICMWLLERSGTDHARCGHVPPCNKACKPQSQTGGAASASCQFVAVTSAAWWNEMGFYADCLSAEIRGSGRADATLGYATLRYGVLFGCGCYTPFV